MPSKSKAQHNLMAMIAHDPKAAKRLGIPQSVGRDYTEADKGRKFGSGGPMKESKSMMKRELSFMKKKGAPKSMIKHEESEMASKTKRYAFGGEASGRAMPARSNVGGASRGLERAAAMSGRTMPSRFNVDDDSRGLERAAAMAGRTMPTRGMKKGGSVGGSFRRAADGVASKGKTKGKMVAMRSGGKCG